MKLLKKTFLAAVLFALLLSCENYTMYHAYRHIPREGWAKGDTLKLDITIHDSLDNNFKIDVLVRNTIDYKYQNLSLAVGHNFPDTAVWKTDTLLFEITDSKGNWRGKGISGLYELVQKLDSSSLNLPQSYSFHIIPLLNDSVLTGINDIGIIARQ